MKRETQAPGDSPPLAGAVGSPVVGGEIPGSGGAPAFSLSGGSPSAIPVLIAVPHAGRAYPAAVLERMRHPAQAALRLEDRHVDRLAEAAAAATGALLLTAQAPRAMLDLNRAADDVDWEMFGRRNPPTGGYAPGLRARSGLGVIPRRVPGLGELWRHSHDESELAARIAGIHEPYHAELARQLGLLHERWGAALLLDLHSMPPLVAKAGQPQAHFVLGDRFGASCHGSLVGSAFGYFAETRQAAAHNRPYAGGYVLERHAAPGRGIHALQLEVDRSCYLDSQLAEPGEGFNAMIVLLVGLVRRLAGEVAAMGEAVRRVPDSPSGWAEAAE